MYDKHIIIRYGEIALKGKNRSLFEARLVKNIKLALKSIDDTMVQREHGRIFVSCHDKDYDDVTHYLSRVFGIVSYSPADVVGLSLDEISRQAITQVNRCISEQHIKTFKIETRRVNKAFPLKSPDVSREVGSQVLNACSDINVDVKKPDIICHIEIRDKAYIYTEVIAGQGGMPYKSAGKAMLLLSGGIDSPVSGYLMAKRGLEIEAVHYHSYPFTSDRAYDKVVTLAKKIAQYTGRVRLHSVNLLNIQKAIAEHCPSDEMTILSRRAMMLIATKIAKERKCQALVTGESLGQVASQTIEGINVTTNATSLPVFRPLIAMDKLDIIKIAHKIDTYETSILPFEDCCTVFLPKRVVTKPRVDKILQSESLISIDKMVCEAVAQADVTLVYGEETFDL